MALSDFFFHPSSTPATASTNSSTTPTDATESHHQPAPCDEATILLEPHHHDHHHEHGQGHDQQELDKYHHEAEEEDCGVIEDTFTFRLDKVLEYVHGHVHDTLRNPKLVLGAGWHEETNTPIGEVDVQFKAVSVVKVSVWPRWTVPYVDVKVQTPATKAFKNAFGSLATTAALSAAIRFVQELPNPLVLAKEAGGNVGGRCDKVGKGLRDLLYYTKPLLFAGAPLPLMMLVHSKGRGVWGGGKQ